MSDIVDFSRSCDIMIWHKNGDEARCDKPAHHAGQCSNPHKLMPVTAMPSKIGLEDSDIADIMNGYCTDRELALCQEIVALRQLNRDQGRRLR